MIKVGGPLLSLTARGWFGRYFYKTHGVVHQPYPIALLGKIRFPYRMPAWGLRPYHSFISQYYSRLGWCYQMRRTWHGIVWSAIRPPISAQPKSTAQEAWKNVFADAVLAWQGLTLSQKKIYNVYKYPIHASGYNRFLREYLLTHVAVPPLVGNFLLQEIGDKILQETGDSLLLDYALVLQENGDYLLQENGDKIIL